MLFALKRSTPAALAMAAVLAGSSFLVAGQLGLDWSLALDRRTLAVAGGAALALLFVDALADRVLRWRYGAAYEAVYGRLLRYFAGQSTAVIAAGGALAAAEELAFRGLVLLGLVRIAGTPPALAVAVAAVVFALLHVTPGENFGPFVPWAVWEGLALGAIFVATGSLVGVALAHAVHDVVGFGIFARQRARGR